MKLNPVPRARIYMYLLLHIHHRRLTLKTNAAPYVSNNQTSFTNYPLTYRQSTTDTMHP